MLENNLKERQALAYRKWYSKARTKIEYKEKSRACTLNWRLNNPKKYLLQHAKSRAKLLGLDCNITEEDIVIPEICPVLETPFEYGTRSSMSVDRIDPNIGYVKGNVQVISWKANAMKQNASKEELRKFANWINQYLA